MRVFMNDDRHAMAKHSVIYPTQEELEGVQNMVSHTERALKAVSDWLDKQEKGTIKPDPDGSDADKERCVGAAVVLHSAPAANQRPLSPSSCLDVTVSTKTKPRALCGA